MDTLAGCFNGIFLNYFCFCPGRAGVCGEQGDREPLRAGEGTHPQVEFVLRLLFVN